MRVIYIDTLFLVNFIVNYLILLATAKVCAKTISRLRIALGAALGAIYAVLSVIPDLAFFSSPWIKVVSGIFLLLIVFGHKPELFRIGLIFFAISAAFGGTVMAISMLGGIDPMEKGIYVSVSLKVLIFSFCLCYAVFGLVFRGLGRGRAHGGTVPVTVEHGGRRVKFTALVDTGNTLADPMTGGGVLVAELEALRPLFPKNMLKILESGEKDAVALMEKAAEAESPFQFHLIPYTAVGAGYSLLLAFRPERVTVSGRRVKKASVAISPTRVSDGGVYSALVNGGKM